MKIEYAAMVGTAFVVWNRILVFWEGLVKIVRPIVEQVEQRAKDGLIDKNDRKEIVLTAIKQLETDKTIKLNFLSRKIISVVVDHVAQKLPDFVIAKGAVEIVTKAEKR